MLRQLAIILCTTFTSLTAYSQTDDSTNKAKLSFDLSIFTVENLKTNMFPQFSLSPTLSYNRHSLNIGVVFGPKFILTGYLPSNNGLYEYLTFDLDQTHYNIHGFETGYYFRLNKELRKTNYYLGTQNLFTWHETLKYTTIIFSKRKSQYLLGMRVERLITKSFFVSFHVLGGIQYHNDATRNTIGNNTYYHNSHRANVLFGILFTYKL